MTVDTLFLYLCKMDMFDNKGTTGIEQLGEFGLIDHLTKNIQLKQKGTLKGIGDDAAVLDFTGKKVLVSTDILMEGIHFDLDLCTTPP